MFLFAEVFAEVDDVEGLAAAATKHLELLKQKDEAESSYLIDESCTLIGQYD
jgi:hypothetical protein